MDIDMNDMEFGMNDLNPAELVLGELYEIEVAGDANLEGVFRGCRHNAVVIDEMFGEKKPGDEDGQSCGQLDGYDVYTFFVPANEKDMVFYSGEGMKLPSIRPLADITLADRYSLGVTYGTSAVRCQWEGHFRAATIDTLNSLVRSTAKLAPAGNNDYFRLLLHVKNSAFTNKVEYHDGGCTVINSNKTADLCQNVVKWYEIATFLSRQLRLYDEWCMYRTIKISEIPSSFTFPLPISCTTSFSFAHHWLQGEPMAILVLRVPGHTVMTFLDGYSEFPDVESLGWAGAASQSEVTIASGVADVMGAIVVHLPDEELQGAQPREFVCIDCRYNPWSVEQSVQYMNENNTLNQPMCRM
jgi:hypothetical protein